MEQEKGAFKISKVKQITQNYNHKWMMYAFTVDPRTFLCIFFKC